MRAIQKTLGHESDYDFSPPRFVLYPTVVSTWKGVQGVLINWKTFKAPWGAALRQLSNYDYMLGSDSPASTEQRKFIGRAIYGPEKSIDDFRQFFELVTADQIQKNAHKLRDTYELDVVKNVANLTWTQFAARLFHMPLRSEKHADAAFTDRQVYELLSVMFTYIFLDTDAASSFALKRAAIKAYRDLSEQVRPVCEAAKALSLGRLIQHLIPSTSKSLPNHGDHLLHRFFESGKSIDEIVSWVVLLSVGIAVPSAQAVSVPRSDFK